MNGPGTRLRLIYPIVCDGAIASEIRGSDFPTVMRVPLQSSMIYKYDMGFLALLHLNPALLDSKHSFF